jgi:hypothetical protein
MDEHFYFWIFLHITGRGKCIVKIHNLCRGTLKNVHLNRELRLNGIAPCFL